MSRHFPCASKAAIENLSSCLRAELAHYGVKVIVLAPGVIHERDVALQ